MPFNKEAKNISIEPCLINQKDAFEVSILTISTNSNFDVKGRIAGVREIIKSKDVDYTFWDHPLTLLLLLGASFSIFILFANNGIFDYLIDISGIFGIISFLISLFCIFFLPIFLVNKYSSPTTKKKNKKNRRRR